ncbi:hypothetical protein [Qipengyuania sp. DGS5-3]|uniref:hypothetical protein n=1 Tax=Qipengyuania sp. DGS5-3 TaxID=3349632 RepID=UPI0036D439E2
MPVSDEQILILCKTYPSPSEKYVETSCVAGIRTDGSLIRLFPVPFRLVKADKQFKKWQFVSAKVEKARKDHRPESYQIKIDTLECEENPLPTKNHWLARRNALKNTSVAQSFSEVETARLETGQSLALLKPARLVGLDIEPVKPAEWTDEEVAKLVAEQRQGALFEDDQVDIRTLRKLPHAFYYRYECELPDKSCESFRHKVVDWEIGALYWRCAKDYGDAWEPKFRQKMWDYMITRDVFFVMGNIHRFPAQWLIVSILYPPTEVSSSQADLFS